MATSIDPRWAWEPYQPTDKEPWDLKKVGHLYRRAGFAATWPELESAVQGGPEKAVDRLLEGNPGQKELDRETGMRITLIDENGKVLVESELDPQMHRIESHADREEVVQAREEGVGVSQRLSATVHKEMMYLALRNPDQHRDWIVAMIAIQIIDWVATIYFVLQGAVTLPQVSGASFLPIIFIVVLIARYPRQKTA